MKYPIATNGIFATVQGEGLLLGTPMVFVRLGGCSVGCPQCDTDYRISRRLTADEIRTEVEKVRTLETWVWVTGGEPADYDLWPLLEAMRLCGRVALATSGHKAMGGAGRLADFISVSPHGTPAGLVLNGGSQINLVPGLNGLRLSDWDDYEPYPNFRYGFVTPMGPVDVEQCRQWILRQSKKSHFEWRLGVQAHKAWGVA